MNNFTSSVSDLTSSALDAAGDAIDAAGDFAGEASSTISDLAGAAIAAAAIPGLPVPTAVKSGMFRGGLSLLRRHPYVIGASILAALGFKYWKSQQDADKKAKDEAKAQAAMPKNPRQSDE